MANDSPVRRLNVRDIARAKGGEPIVSLTAYTAPVARIVDEACDFILVGDSLGMVLYGMDSTVGVTVDMMIAHGRAVVRATRRACIVVDLPFGSYQQSPAQAFGTAARIVAETGCAAVKLEGGQEMAETIDFLTVRGVPVLGHIGLMPQSVNAAGFQVQGKTEESARRILADARGGRSRRRLRHRNREHGRAALAYADARTRGAHHRNWRVPRPATVRSSSPRTSWASRAPSRHASSSATRRSATGSPVPCGTMLPTSAPGVSPGPEHTANPAVPQAKSKA